MMERLCINIKYTDEDLLKYADFTYKKTRHGKQERYKAMFYRQLPIVSIFVFMFLSDDRFLAFVLLVVMEVGFFLGLLLSSRRNYCVDAARQVRRLKKKFGDDLYDEQTCTISRDGVSLCGTKLKLEARWDSLICHETDDAFYFELKPIRSVGSGIIVPTKYLDNPSDLQYARKGSRKVPVLGIK